MRLLSILSSLVLGIQTVAAASAATEAMPAPPTLAFLFSANITAGLSVDVGGIPSGNVSVIPVIGGSLIGPDVSGKVLAIGAEWALAAEGGQRYSDMRAQIRTPENVNIYMQMAGLMQGPDGQIYARTTFQTGSQQYYWLNFVFAVGYVKPVLGGYVATMWYLK